MARLDQLMFRNSRAPRITTSSTTSTGPDDASETSKSRKGSRNQNRKRERRSTKHETERRRDAEEERSFGGSSHRRDLVNETSTVYADQVDLKLEQSGERKRAL
eukprot:140216-Prorocentrum_minimum.AAC.2